jgi:predicted ABC-type ATPase
MNEEESQLGKNALTFIKQERRGLIKKFADPDVFRSVSRPVSLFMAGSPGAGKTEVSKNLMKKFHNVPIRIDADEIRAMCPGYIGSNAHVFQEAANKGVNILFDYALHKNLNLILDATFAYAGAAGNIKRALDYHRIVEIWFVYQNPLKAWEATKAREFKETRHVSREVFIEAFFKSKENVQSVKREFSNTIELNLLMKDYDKKMEELKLNIGVDDLDRYLNDGYTKNDLKELIL